MGEVHRVEVTPDIPGPEAPAKEQPQAPPQGKSEERPAWLPEKFWKDGKADYEGLAKSYGELEKGKPSQEAPKQDGLNVEKKDQPSGEQTPKAGDEQAAQSSIPGVTQEQSQQYWNELSTEGKLSDKSYEALAKAGYPKTVVDAYIKGIQAEQSTQASEISEVKKLAGGDEGYAAMADWMSTNLSAEELAEYNEAVNSGKKSVVKLAVQGMHARYTEAMGGPEPKLLGGKPGAEQGDVFRSHAEVTAAMRDRRYKTDEGYRQHVAKKLARSKF